jgi:hypothetical protein
MRILLLSSSNCAVWELGRRKIREKKRQVELIDDSQIRENENGKMGKIELVSDE